MQTKDKQLAQIPTEQLAKQVIEALQTEEGQKQLQPLFQQFQTEMGQSYQFGGKIENESNIRPKGGIILNFKSKQFPKYYPNLQKLQSEIPVDPILVPERSIITPSLDSIKINKIKRLLNESKGDVYYDSIKPIQDFKNMI